PWRQTRIFAFHRHQTSRVFYQARWRGDVPERRRGVVSVIESFVRQGDPKPAWLNLDRVDLLAPAILQPPRRIGQTFPLAPAAQLLLVGDLPPVVDQEHVTHLQAQ